MNRYAHTTIRWCAAPSGLPDGPRPVRADSVPTAMPAPDRIRLERWVAGGRGVPACRAATAGPTGPRGPPPGPPGLPAGPGGPGEPGAPGGLAGVNVGWGRGGWAVPGRGAPDWPVPGWPVPG